MVEVLADPALYAFTGGDRPDLPALEVRRGRLAAFSLAITPAYLAGMSDDAPCNCGCPNTFSTKDADADLKRYLKQGPDRTTRALIDAIVAEGVEGATLLDIGGGIGAIQWELLASGVARSTTVDATEAYVAAARAEAERRGYGDRTTGRAGTFEEIASEIEPVDIVTLDRVVCCDPNLAGLLASAAGHARRMVGLVYPRGTWWNRLAGRVMNAFAWLARDHTRWHLHQPADIDRILTGAGFRRREIDRTFVWQVALYVRP
ncbi:MAG TPA: methyltransferase domain-containing protein [Candidatus Limnocylindria bacterium]|nr:methyltransferase domain-containing protein [Candidatus Limnocylindria bacterium]